VIRRAAQALPLAEATLAARVLWSLPSLRRGRPSPEQARETLRRRLERRAADFLALVQRTVYQHDASPHRQLLRLAGCEFGDLENLVTGDGLEGALRTLYRQGVYLTVEEYKGRRPTVRGSATVTFEPQQLGNPLVASHILQHTSGSRGRATPSSFDLAYIRERTVGQTLYFDALGGGRWHHAIWEPPGGGSILRMLDFMGLGVPVKRWFSPIDPASAGLNPHRRWIGHVLWLGGALAGTSPPRPRVVPIDAPLPIVHWMAETIRSGDAPHLMGVPPSCAVRLCQAAYEAGIDLGGAHFTITGEPVTRVRLQQIRRAGAQAVPTYTAVDAGRIGFGCLDAAASDEVHLLDDWHVAIQPGVAGARPSLPPKALLLSSLRASAPLIMLNVSLGDQAELASGRCGCPMERQGWTTRLHSIRSFEKLTAGGMTFLDVDVIRVLDEVLPGRFGGGPTDYQLIEEETEDGRPRVRLLVHPRVGELDVDAVGDAFLTAIGGHSEGERLMELQWRQDRMLRVERVAPRITRTGKILHLHLERGEATSGGAG
jgi:hypothetical protein